MRVIYVVGCCLCLAAITAPTEGVFGFGKRKNNDDELPVGLVTTSALPPSQPQPQPPPQPQPQPQPQRTTPQAQQRSAPAGQSQQRSTNPAGQSQQRSTNPAGQSQQRSAQPAGQSQQRSTQSASAQNPRQSNPPAGRPTSPPPATRTTQTRRQPQNSSPPPMQYAPGEERRLLQDPNSKAVVVAGNKAMTATQNQIKQNKKTTTQLERKVDDLKNDISKKGRDGSLEKLLAGELLDVTKQRVKVRFLLLLYGVVNFLLFVVQNVGAFTIPAVGKTVYFVDLFTKNIVRKPLDDYYAEYMNTNADAVARYIANHPEEYTHVKKGKRVKLKTSLGDFDMKVLKQRPEEKLADKELHIVDQNPLKVFRTAYSLKR